MTLLDIFLYSNKFHILKGKISAYVAMCNYNRIEWKRNRTTSSR